MMKKVLSILYFFTLAATPVLSEPVAIAPAPVAQSPAVPPVVAPATSPATSSAHANEKAVAMLSQLSANIAALGNYRVEFGVDAEGGQTLGCYIVSGNSFKIMTPEFNIIGDGVSRYEINHGLQEVVVDRMDSTDINILVNPVKAFEFVRNGFVPYFRGEIVTGGVNSELIEMLPLAEDSAISGVRLYVGSDSGLPVRLEYTLDGLDEKIAVSVTSFRKDINIKPSDFVFDKSKYKDYEVVDFR